MKYFGLFKENTLVSISRLFIKVEGYECKEITKSDYENFENNQNKFIKLEQEETELVNWFEGYYRTQIEQYQRCQRLGIEFDKNINELDNQAKSYQERIREIRNLLK